MSHHNSAGARFRAALAAEKPLQIIGAINAFFVTRLKVASIIVTLGTMSLARGIASCSGGATCTAASVTTELEGLSSSSGATSSWTIASRPSSSLVEDLKSLEKY